MNPFDNIQGPNQNSTNPFAGIPAPNTNPAYSSPTPANPAFNAPQGPNPGGSYFSNWARTYMDQNGQSAMPMNANVSPFAKTPFVGKYISDPKEIFVQDVPTDGRMAIFPLRDCSAIIAKAWNANNGSISTVRYIPDPAQFQTPMEEEPRDDMADILMRLEKLEQSIGQSTKQSTNTRRAQQKGEDQ